jgi:hypothetical protein
MQFRVSETMRPGTVVGFIFKQDVPSSSPGVNVGTNVVPAFLAVTAASPANSPVITAVSTYQEDALVYLSVRYTDADGDAEGFGFRGVKGSGWAPESHPFSSPSYGRASPGRIDYPFNHGCGQGSEIETDVEFWIYDSGGRRSTPVVTHLSCS